MVANFKVLNPLSELLSEVPYFSGSFFLQGLYGALSDAGNPVNQTSGSGFIVKVPSGGATATTFGPLHSRLSQ
jgi:hypothetical protein